MEIDIAMSTICTKNNDIRYAVGFANKKTMTAVLAESNEDAAKSKEHMDKLAKRMNLT